MLATVELYSFDKRKPSISGRLEAEDLAGRCDAARHHNREKTEMSADV